MAKQGTPQFGNTFPSFPTPIVENTIEQELINIESAGYEIIEYGTPYNSVDHGNFPKDLPDHILVSDEPADATGFTRKRTWASNRIDEDLYNFQIDYEGNNPDYPIYTRIYVLPRNGYSPLPALSPDPIDESAKLINETMTNELQPAELANQYVKVTRIYHTLPGQITFSVEYPYGGDVRFPRATTIQKVASGTVVVGNPGSACPLAGYEKAKMVSQKAEKTESANIELLKGIYEITPLINDQSGYGYSVTYVLNNQDYPMISWVFTVRKNDYVRGDDLSACPIHGYEHLVLVREEMTGEQEQPELAKVTRQYERMPGQLVYKVDYENNDPSYPILNTSQRLPRLLYQVGNIGIEKSLTPGYEYLTLYEQKTVLTDNVNIIEDQRLYEQCPGGEIKSYDYDTDLNIIVNTVKRKVPTTFPPTVLPLTVALEQQPVDKWRTLQIVTSLPYIPDDKVEYYTGKFPFPTLLTGISLFVVELTSATDKEVIWYPNTLRPLQNVPAVFRVTTRFYTSQPPNVDIFVMPTRDIVYRGRSFQIIINNVLSNEISLSAAFSGDTTYGDLTEGISFAPTNPSASDYYRSIGTYQVVGCDATRYRGNIWSLQVSEVILA